MSIANFIPEIWSAQILKRQRAALVFESLCNTNYDGDITNMGDTVHIQSIGPIASYTYTPNVDINAPDQLNDEQRSLLIDQGNYFNFEVDDVDRRQALGTFMEEAAIESGYSLASAVDKYVAGLYTHASSATASTAVNSQNVVSLLQSLGQSLDEKNVPDNGRWVVLPPWLITKLQLAKMLVADGSNLAAEAIATRSLGNVAGFEVMKSNNVNNDGTTWNVMAGDRGAITLATQILKTEAYTPQYRFADAIKGLNVWGAKVVRPDNIAVLTATVGAEP